MKESGNKGLQEREQVVFLVKVRIQEVNNFALIQKFNCLFNFIISYMNLHLLDLLAQTSISTQPVASPQSNLTNSNAVTRMFLPIT